MRKVIFWSFLSFSLISRSFTTSLSANGEERLSIVRKDSFLNQSKINQITQGNFLVVGSFINVKNAQSYSDYLNKNSHKADLGYYKGNQKFYVYLFQSMDLQELRNRRDRVRSSEEFRDAWILSVEGTQAKAIRDNSEVIIPQNNVEEKPSETTEIKSKEVTNPGMKLYNLYMNVVAATTYKEIPANVKLIYSDQSKVVDILESHKTKKVEMPVNGDQRVQLICDVFGYKKVEQDLDLSKPLSETSKSYVQVLKDTILVNFELVRYKKGELFTMFNVFFYNDAAIMLPKSAYELTSLVQMVKENENLQIKLHGHTNGNDNGRIIKLAPDDNEYFSLKPTNVQSKGSAKELSLARAEVIKKYLLEQGIDEKRIEVKGWGGSKTLYPIKSPDALKNVRVEIEILKD